MPSDPPPGWPPPGPPEPPRDGEPGAGGPRRLHPATPLYGMLSAFGRLGVVVAFVLLTGGLAALPLLVILAGVFVHRYVAWTRFSYHLDGTTLRIDEGVISRSQRVVPCERIQKVDLVQNLFHRMGGVAVLRVETAGGPGGAEVDLAVLGRADAEQLRARLLAAKATARAAGGGSTAPDAPGQAPSSRWSPPPPAPSSGWAASVPPPAPLDAGWAEEPEQVLLRIGPARLALAGVTGAQLAVMFAVVGWLAQLLRDVPPQLLEDLDPTTVQPPSEVVIVAGVLVLILLWIGLAAGASIVTDAGYTLALAGDEVRVRRGLFEQREATIPLGRVQVVRVQRSILRRGIGMAALRIQSASDGGKGARVTVPIVALGEVPRLLDALLPGGGPSGPVAPSAADRRPALARPPRAARQRAIVRRVLPTLAVAGPLAVATRPWGLLGLLAVAPAAALGVAYYRSLGHARLPDHVVARAGVLVEETAVVPVAKTQSTRVRSTWFQRRRGLATLYVDVAGPGPTPAVRDEAGATAEALLRSVVEDERVIAHDPLR